MEKAVRHRKRGARTFGKRGYYSTQNPQPFFREHINRHLSNILNDENTTNTVRQGIHRIHLGVAIRFMRKRSVM